MTNDLAQALITLGQELATEETNRNGPPFHVEVGGAPRDLRPVVRDEVYRIAREVLRNAFRHANAHQIEAEIRYDPGEFRLRIRDDGKGIAPTILEKGKRAGHWGLPGIQERAQRVGAKLDVWSEAGVGTEVQLTLPAVLAYGTLRERSGFRLFRRTRSQERSV